MIHNTLKIDDDDELHVPAAEEFSPLRKLARLVLAEAVREAEANRRGSHHLHPAHTNATMLPAIEWLHRWPLVEPWCRVAEIPTGKLRRRIQQLEVGSLTPSFFCPTVEHERTTAAHL